MPLPATRLVDARLRRHRRRSRGGAVLETILILPVVIMLVLGAIEFGYFFWVKHTCEGAARDGCRVFIMAGTTLTDVQTAVDNAMKAAGLQNAGYTVYVGDGTPPAYPSLPPQVVSGKESSCVAGDTISVYVTCKWSVVGQGYRMLGSWDPIDGNKNVVGQAVMRKEG
jgi:Flp pilus assembly protein TadG